MAYNFTITNTPPRHYIEAPWWRCYTSPAIVASLTGWVAYTKRSLKGGVL